MSRFADAAFAQMSREMSGTSAAPRREKAQILRRRLFPQQLALVDDPAKRIATLCPRRAGKTTSAIYRATIRALETNSRRHSVVFATLVRDLAKRLFWDPLLALNQELELDIAFNHSELIATFPHGPRFMMRGAENDADAEKFRGPSYDEFYLDECGVWQLGSRIAEMVQAIIGPALSDRRGALLLLGSPGDVLKGEFYDATGPLATEIGEGKALARPYAERNAEKWAGIAFTWSSHWWSRHDNTAIPHLWEESLAEKERWGWQDDSPRWVREHLGRWMADDSKLVFRYDADRNSWSPKPGIAGAIDSLPPGHTWRFVLGADMGFKDPFALQMFAYSDTHPDAWHVGEYEEKNLSIFEIADHTKRFRSAVGDGNLEALVGDFQTLGDTVWITLQELDCPYERAVKKDKRDHIELFNSELQDGRIHIIRGSRLENEMLFLSWDDTGLKEKSAQPNHNCDAALYTMRRLRHREARPLETKLKPGTPEATLAKITQADEQLIRDRQRDRRIREGNATTGDLYGGARKKSDFDDGGWY